MEKTRNKEVLHCVGKERKTRKYLVGKWDRFIRYNLRQPGLLTTLMERKIERNICTDRKDHIVGDGGWWRKKHLNYFFITQKIILFWLSLPLLRHKIIILILTTKGKNRSWSFIYFLSRVVYVINYYGWFWNFWGHM